MPIYFAGWPVTRTFLDIQGWLPAHLTRRASIWTEQNLLGDPFQENSLIRRHIGLRRLRLIMTVELSIATDSTNFH